MLLHTYDIVSYMPGSRHQQEYSGSAAFWRHYRLSPHSYVPKFLLDTGKGDWSLKLHAAGVVAAVRPGLNGWVNLRVYVIDTPPSLWPPIHTDRLFELCLVDRLIDFRGFLTQPLSEWQ